MIPSNYPPGVSGNEPEIVGYDEEPCGDPTCPCADGMSCPAGEEWSQ